MGRIPPKASVPRTGRSGLCWELGYAQGRIGAHTECRRGRPDRRQELLCLNREFYLCRLSERAVPERSDDMRSRG